MNSTNQKRLPPDARADCDVFHARLPWKVMVKLWCVRVSYTYMGGIDGKLGGLTPMNSYAPFVCIRGIKLNRPRSLAVTRQRVIVASY